MSQHELSETEELEIEQSTDIPSIYRGGTVSLEPGTGGSAAEPPKHAKQTSIVCQTEYCHLSPEELRFLDLKIHLDPPRWEISYEEERLRYYLDEGLTSGPQFGPPMPAPAFSVSSRVKSTSSDSESSYLGLGCSIPEELATGTCSRCAARLDAGVEGDEEAEATSEESESDRDTSTSSTSHHGDTRDKKKRKGISRRVRRLEKTVESLLSQTPTERQDGTTTADGRKIDNSRMVDSLSAALSGL